MEAGIPKEIIEESCQNVRKRSKSSSSQKHSSSTSDFEDIELPTAEEEKKIFKNNEQVNTTADEETYHSHRRNSTSFKNSFRRTFRGVKKMFHNLHTENTLYKASSTPNIKTSASTPKEQQGARLQKKKHHSSTSDGLLDGKTIQHSGEIRRRKVSWANKIDNWLEHSDGVYSSPYTTKRRNEENIFATSPLAENNMRVSWGDLRSDILEGKDKSQRTNNVKNMSKQSTQNTSITFNNIGDENKQFKSESREKSVSRLDNNHFTKSSNQKVINSSIDKTNKSSVVNSQQKRLQDNYLNERENLNATNALHVNKKNTTYVSLNISPASAKKMTTASITPRAQLYVIEDRNKVDYNNNNTTENISKQIHRNDNSINKTSHSTTDKVLNNKTASPQTLQVPQSPNMFSFDDIDINLQEHVDYLQRSLTAPRKHSKKHKHGLQGDNEEDKENTHLTSEDIRTVVENVVHYRLDEKKFDSGKVTTWCKEISNSVRDELKIITRNKKKVVATTYIGSKINDSQVHVSVKCQKSISTDEFLTIALEGEDMYVWVTMLMADY